MKKEHIKLGIAPIGWTNDDLPELGGDIPFEQCVSEMALAGYEGSEVGNKYPKDPAVLKSYLEPRGVSICNAWFSTFFTSKPEEETVAEFIKHRDFLWEMGAKVVGCSEQGNSIQGLDKPIFAAKPIYTNSEWEKVAKGMNRLGKLAAEKGMKAALHHHMGTGVQTPDEIDRFMEMTDENVWLLYDTGHIYYSEGSQAAAEEVLKKHVKRVAHVHLKDVRDEVVQKVRRESLSFLNGVKLGAFTVPGDGNMSFDAIFDILDRNGYRGWMVVEAEQDPYKANPFLYALKGRRFIREKTGL